MVDGTPFLYRIDSKPRFALLCLVPKAGSSMWLRALTRGLIEQGLPVQEGSGKWHGQALPYNTSARDVEISKIPRYMIVRHPVARLLSAYLGKANRPELKGLPGLPDGWDTTNRNVSFRGFVDALLRTNSSRLDAHFRPQVEQCGISALRQANAVKDYGYRYLRAEEIGHWYREVVCALGLTKAVSTETSYWRNYYTDPKELAHTPALRSSSYNVSTSCFVRTSDCGCDIRCRGHHCNASRAGTLPDASFASFHRAVEKLDDYYDEDLARRVNEWAADDMKEFGYEPWLPGQPAPGGRSALVRQ